MSSAVHVVGIKGVVFSLEGGKEKGDGYKPGIPMTGNSRGRTKASTPHRREAASWHRIGPASGMKPGTESSRPCWAYPTQKVWLVTTDQFAEKKQRDYAVLQN